MSYYFSILPEHYLLFSILALLIFNIIYSLSKANNFPNFSSFNYMATMSILFNFLILNIIDLPMSNILFNNFFIKNNFHSYYEILISGVLIISLPHIAIYNKRKYINTFEFYILILFSLLSSSLIMSCMEFITFFILLEMQSLCFYLLVSYNRFSYHSITGGIKYFILSSSISILFLLSFFILYLFTGSMNFIEISYILKTIHTNEKLLFLSFILMSLVFLFKIYSVPFHSYISDVYQRAPLSSIAILSVIPTLSNYYVYRHFIHLFFIPILEYVQFFLSVISILTILIGTLLTINQSNIKRIFAYSTVTNIGYVLYFVPIQQTEVFLYSIYFLSIYIINISVILLMFLILFDKNNQKEIINIYELSGLFESRPYLAILLSLNLFSLAGIPPFAFFFSKLYLLSLLVSYSQYFLCFIILFATILTSFYYLRIIKNMVFVKYYTTPFNYRVLCKTSNYFFILILTSVLLFAFAMNPSLLLLFMFDLT